MAKHGSESVTDGTTTIGVVISNDRGFEAYAAGDCYLATYPTIKEARRAIYEAHKGQDESSR